MGVMHRHTTRSRANHTSNPSTSPPTQAVSKVAHRNPVATRNRDRKVMWDRLLVVTGLQDGSSKDGNSHKVHAMLAQNVPILTHSNRPSVCTAVAASCTAAGTQWTKQCAFRCDDVLHSTGLDSYAFLFWL